MSASSRFYAEIREQEQWYPLPPPKISKGKQIPVHCLSIGTPYELYAALVGYERWSTYPFYHTEPIIPLSEPRGFPADMNRIYQDYFGEEHLCPVFHRLTWFLVQEVIDYPWDNKFPPFTAYVKSQYAHLFSADSEFPKEFPEDESLYLYEGESRTEISWVESYRDFVGCGDWFISELVKLGDPYHVRIIFWLDY
jgi:hypothetical protein